MASAGEVLFARYAYAPNELGYCGPAETAALLELGATGRTDADIVSIARRFSGAWPYATLLADLMGVADPLDARIMRAYWLGGPLFDDARAAAFGIRLLELIAGRAGHYWDHLTPDLIAEAAPTHGFHVFGVYPWTRLLAEVPDHALHVLDNCRIRWGEVLAIEPEHVLVASIRLAWDGVELSLAAPVRERVRFDYGGQRFVAAPVAGDCLALHWDTVCDRLDTDQQRALEQSTRWQLEVTNRRLAGAQAHADRGSR